MVNSLKILKDDSFWGQPNFLDNYEQILNNSKFLRDSTQSANKEEIKILKSTLILWGLMYCKGTIAEKTDNFFEILSYEGH